MPSPALFTLPALRRARDLIDRRCSAPLDLDAMAREAAYSKYHFATAFAASVRRDAPRLRAKGVTFLQEPIDRPYGVEAVFRDDSGSWFSLTERRPG